MYDAIVAATVSATVAAAMSLAVITGIMNIDISVYSSLLP